MWDPFACSCTVIIIKRYIKITDRSVIIFILGFRRKNGMKIGSKIIVGLTIIVFVLVQNQEALAEKVIINDQGSNPECRLDKSCFFPSNIVIQQGQDVIWYNADSSIHSIITQSRQFGSSGIISSGNILPGDSYSHSFADSGYINYYCILHPWMQGLVVVE